MLPQLIKTIAEVKAQVPVNMTSDFAVVAPFLRQAETMYVQRVIGAEQFGALVTAYNDTPAGNVIEAIALAQKVISNLGYYFAVPVLNVSVGSTGITIISNESTKTAFQWQVAELKDSLAGLGFNGIEELLSLMTDNPDDFDPYISSPLFTDPQACLIKTATEFSDLYDIGNSRFIFQSINYIMKRIEQQDVVKIIGATYLQTLKGDGLSDEQKTLVNTFMKPGIALITISKALVERVLTFKNGIVSFNYKGRTANLDETLPGTPEQIGLSSEQLYTDGSRYLQDGLQYIADNPSAFTDFVAPEPRRRFRVTNKPGGLFAN